MSSASDKNASSEIADGAAAPGIVEVSRTVGAPPARIWEALTDPEVVAHWFGDLSAALCEGGMADLEFGDGDFFRLHVLRADPPVTLQYAWRFLAVGPLDTVTWQIIPTGDGSRVTVTDGEPGRTQESGLQLRQGWLDFTRRLKNYLEKGKPTRYEWRHDLDASIELTGDAAHVWRVLFDAAAQSRWLPLAGGVLETGAHIAVEDGDAPALLQVSDLSWCPPTGVSFKLVHESWRQPTSLSLQLTPRGGATLLSLSHGNWKAIGGAKDYPRRQRKRFCALWVATMLRGRRLTASENPRDEVRAGQGEAARRSAGGSGIGAPPTI